MKFYCTPVKRRKKRIKKRQIGISLILVGTITVLILADTVVRTIIQGYPMSVASGIMTEMMDKAMDNILTEVQLDPSSVDRIQYSESGQVLSIETDTTELNKLKTAFTAELSRLMKDYGDTVTVGVPIGTLIGHEYTLGRGPRIHFDLQYSYSVSTELTSTFYEAGINNTVHSIELTVTNKLFVIIPWGHTTKDITTKYIVAETVIVGAVPEAFTNIYGASDEITDDVIDFGAEVK